MGGRPMKKLLVGCLIILALGGIFLGVGAYFLYRAASPMLQDARNYLQRMSELGEVEKSVANKSSYAPPATNELSSAQMQRFARVQDSVRVELGQRMAEIDEKYKHLKDSVERNDQPPSIGDMLSALGEMTHVIVDARRFQVAALNREGFSLAEYAWVRDRVFEAAGTEWTSRIDLHKLEEAVRKGTGSDGFEVPQLPSPNVPEQNRALVKPYLEQMNRWIPLAFFGF
jgi:hypothetical protein